MSSVSPPTTKLATSPALLTYLQDHLAASVGALNLMTHLQECSPAPEDAAMLAQLLKEVTEDRDLVEKLLIECGGSPSEVKGMGAWVAEKAGRLKLWASRQEAEGLFWLQAFETLCLALRGKSALWQLLSHPQSPLGEGEAAALSVFETHAKRSAAQEAMVEAARIRAGLAVLQG